MDIVDWLQDLGLERYVETFEENGIDYDILTSLSPDDLREAGVKAVGDRRKMLDAIERMRTAASDEKPDSVVPTEHAITERRQMTILFCDIVGSTEIVARSDPEEVRGLLTEFFRVVDDQMQAQNGYIAKRLGDGALVYFGYPMALENNAESAAHAALGIVRETGHLSWPDGTPLQVRVGFATGTVVVGDAIGIGEASEVEVVGDTAHLAARLQALAKPGHILIDDRSRRFLGDLMRYEDYGLHELKGYSRPVQLSRILGVSSARGRFAALRAGRMSGFVGRSQSLGRLTRACEAALAGKGRPICVSGPAGIGKSRIVHELTVIADESGMEVISWFCSIGEQNSPFAPVIGHYKQLLESSDGGLRDVLLPDVEDFDTTIQLFEHLMGQPITDHELAGHSPARIRRATIEAIVDQIVMAAKRRAVLLVLEDYHWIDPTTAEVLEILANRAADVPLIVLETQRPTGQETWPDIAGTERIDLPPIDRETCRQIVRQVFGDRELSDDQMEQIIDKADGIPLFVEELARSSAEAEGTAIGSVPDTLQDALMARVDKQLSLRRVIQTAALIGRSFSQDLLYAVVPRSKQDIDKSLGAMVSADIIVADETPGADYRFQHALLQDTLAGALLRNERAEIHGKIADVLIAEQADKGHTHDRIAYHFAQAGQSMRALGLYVVAAQLALGRFANREAIGHLERALELAANAPSEAARDEAELGIHTLRGLALMMLSGWAAKEVGEAYHRAQELWHKVGAAAPDKFPIAMGMLSYSIVRGQLAGSTDLAQEALEIAEAAGSDELIIAAEHEYGASLLYRGHLEEAERHLKRCVDLYIPGEHDSHMAFCGKHQVVSGYLHLGMVNACRGRIDANAANVARALELAEHLNHPFSIGFARLVACSNLRCALDLDALPAAADIALEHGKRQDYPHVIAQAMVLQGWVIGLAGRTHDGLALATAGLDMWTGMGARLGSPQYHGLLAELLMLDGCPDIALDTADIGINIQNETGEFKLASDIWRIKGDIQRQLGADANTLQQTYLNALDAARKTGSPHYGLVALSRLAKLDAQYSLEFRNIIETKPKFISPWLHRRLSAEE